VNIEVKVIAGARKRELRLEGSRLKAKLMAKPIQGKANEELIELIADTFGVKKREVQIVAGEKDTRKVLSIPVNEDRFRQIMNRDEGTEKR
jgi:uncharacterized protein